MFKINIEKQLNFVLKETDLSNLGKKYTGKVRDVYVSDDKVFLITTDRQSAFDRVLATIPFKGQVLTQISEFWFEKTKDIIQNHVLEVPDPNVMICKRLKIFPVEFIVRGYLTGVTSTSVWTDYENGSREFCGNVLPNNMVKNQKFDKPMITPTTKSDEHDENISGKEIVECGLMTQKQWDFVADKAFKLFERGTEIAAKNGLILVDTKYEFGYDEEGTIFLVDELHTPDSSRYWLSDSYDIRILNKQEPENIDKEFLRLWFNKNCNIYIDKVLPEVPKEFIIELSHRYIRLFEMITGSKFKDKVGDVHDRISVNLYRWRKSRGL